MKKIKNFLKALAFPFVWTWNFIVSIVLFVFTKKYVYGLVTGLILATILWDGRGAALLKAAFEPRVVNAVQFKQVVEVKK